MRLPSWLLTRGSVRFRSLDYAIGVAQPMNNTVVHQKASSGQRRKSRQLWCRNTLTCAPKALLTADLLRPIYEKPQRTDFGRDD
jgi:S-adenosylmethionine synthetase